MRELATKEHVSKLLVILITRNQDFREEYIKSAGGVLLGASVYAEGNTAEINNYKGVSQRIIGRNEDGSAIYEKATDGFFITASGKSSRGAKGSRPPPTYCSASNAELLDRRLSAIEKAIKNKLNIYQIAWVTTRFQLWRLSIKDIAKQMNVEYPVIYKPVKRAIEIAENEIASEGGRTK